MSTTPISHCQLHDPKQLSEMTGIDLRIAEAFLSTMEGGPNDPPVEPTLEGLWSFYAWACRYDDQPDEEGRRYWPNGSSFISSPKKLASTPVSETKRRCSLKVGEGGRHLLSSLS